MLFAKKKQLLMLLTQIDRHRNAEISEEDAVNWVKTKTGMS